MAHLTNRLVHYWLRIWLSVEGDGAERMLNSEGKNSKILKTQPCFQDCALNDKMILKYDLSDNTQIIIIKQVI